MKKLLIALLLMIVLNCKEALAITNKCNWSSVTTYNDGTSVGSTVINYIIYRSTKQNLSNPVVIGITTNTALNDDTAKTKTNYYYYCIAYVVSTKPSAKSNVVYIRR